MKERKRKMKKLKAILIIVILCGVFCLYHNNIADFIKQMPFFDNSSEYEPEMDKSSYEYYFKSYTENY